MEWSGFALLALGAFAGALVQAASGFGFALLAAPVFLAAMGSTSAIQVLVALHVVQSAMVVPRLVAEAPPRTLRWLIGGSVVGFPLGLAVFLRLDIGTLKLAVGGMMLAFTTLLLLRDAGLLGVRQVVSAETADPAARGRGWLAGVVGFGSGFLTSVLVMPGPPLILYLLGAGTGKQASRALSLTFFAFCYVVVTGLHASAGGMGADEWRLVALLAPAVVAGTLAGNRIASRLSEGWFRVVVYAVLIVSGSYAVVSTL